MTEITLVTHENKGQLLVDNIKKYKYLTIILI